MSRRGPEPVGSPTPAGLTPAADRHATTATTPLLRAGTVRLPPVTREVAGSSPARGAACPGSSVG